MRDGLFVLISIPLLLAAALVVLLLAPDRRGDTSVALDCVSGEAARNPVAADGSTLPRGDLFETVANAEAFICQDVPQVQDTGDWFVLYAVAYRSHSLDEYPEGSSVAAMSRRVEIRYDNPDIGSTLTLMTVTAGLDPDCRQGDGDASSVAVQGRDAILWERLDAGYTGAIVCWQDGAQWNEAHLVVHDQTLDLETEVLPDVLALIETVR